MDQPSNLLMTDHIRMVPIGLTFIADLALTMELHAMFHRI